MTEDQKAKRREYLREYDRKRRAANPGHHLKLARARYHKDIEKTRAKSRARYKAHPELRAIYRKRNWMKYPGKHLREEHVRHKAFRAALDAFKLERGCCDCGYKAHPAALDFDHVNGDKKVLVSCAGSIATALEEAKKCEIRCANCHRIATYNRKQCTGTRKGYEPPAQSEQLRIPGYDEFIAEQAGQ